MFNEWWMQWHWHKHTSGSSESWIVWHFTISPCHTWLTCWFIVSDQSKELQWKTGPLDRERVDQESSKWIQCPRLLVTTARPEEDALVEQSLHHGWRLLDQRKSKVPQYSNAFQVALAKLEAKFIWQSFALHKGYPCPILFGSCRIAYILHTFGDVRNKHISSGQPIKDCFLFILG